MLGTMPDEYREFYRPRAEQMVLLRALDVCQASTEIIYCRDPGTETRLLRSTDLGETWQPLEMPKGETDTRYGGIYVHPANPSHLVALGPNETGMVRSTDGGRTWQRLSGLPALRRPQPDASRGPEPQKVAFDPRDPDTFYVASDAVYRTRDGGTTFERLGTGLPGEEILQLAVSPVDGTVYAAIPYHGVYRLEIEEAPATTDSDE
jgi:photosystem II stability/assembly factor-like uncharacterized protein